MMHYLLKIDDNKKILDEFAWDIVIRNTCNLDEYGFDPLMYELIIVLIPNDIQIPTTSLMQLLVIFAQTYTLNNILLS